MYIMYEYVHLINADLTASSLLIATPALEVLIQFMGALTAFTAKSLIDKNDCGVEKWSLDWGEKLY